jgi:hypothetical protein
MEQLSTIPSIDPLGKMIYGLDSSIARHMNCFGSRQLGTPDNERVSALQVDTDGDVLVLGDSNGSFMRQKKQGDTTTDIFLLRLSKSTGEYPVSVSDAVQPQHTCGYRK